MAIIIVRIWVRTVTYPNLACGIEMSLVSKWWLGKEKGKEAYTVPKVVGDHVEYSIGHNPKRVPAKQNDGIIDRNGVCCLACKVRIGFDYLRSEGRSGRTGAELTAIAAEERGSRTHLRPDRAHTVTAFHAIPSSTPMGEPLEAASGFRVQAHGMLKYSDLSSSHQLTALATFPDLVGEARERVLQDALAGRVSEGECPEVGGVGAAAHADAMVTYLDMAVDQVSAVNCFPAKWNAAPSKGGVMDVFSRQALPMVWDYAGGDPFQQGPANLGWSIERVSGVLPRLPAHDNVKVFQADAVLRDYQDAVISTDSPYYDNIGYSDLFDSFYIRLRRSLKGIHLPLSSTMPVSRAEELVANPY